MVNLLWSIAKTKLPFQRCDVAGCESIAKYGEGVLDVAKPFGWPVLEYTVYSDVPVVSIGSVEPSSSPSTGGVEAMAPENVSG